MYNEIFPNTFLKILYNCYCSEVIVFPIFKSSLCFLGATETRTHVHCDSAYLPHLPVAHKVLQSYFYFVPFNGQ